MVCIAVHKPTPLGLRPRVLGFVNRIQTSITITYLCCMYVYSTYIDIFTMLFLGY